MARSSQVFPPLVAVFLTILAAWVALVSRTDPARADVLQADEQLHWFKGNMHTHSHWSDGDDYLESIAAWYRDRDYNFLVFTDHNVLADSDRWVEIDKTKGGRTAFDKLTARFPDWVETRMDGGKQEVRLRRFTEVAERMTVNGKFLLIQGEEISDKHHQHPFT